MIKGLAATYFWAFGSDGFLQVKDGELVIWLVQIDRSREVASD